MGAFAGHMMHPYEDNDMSLYELYRILQSTEYFVEKVDGINLMVLKSSKGLGFVRNKSQAIMGGVDKKELIREMPESVQDLLYEACMDIVRAFKTSNMPNGTLINLEVINSKNNISIPYEGKHIVIHNCSNIGEGSSSAIHESHTSGTDFLKEYVDTSNLDELDHRFHGPIIHESPVSSVDSLLREALCGKGSHRKVGEIKRRYFKNLLNDLSLEYGLDIPDETTGLIINRWSTGKKSGPEGASLREIKKGLEKKGYKLIRNIDQNFYVKLRKDAIKEFKLAVLQAGDYILNAIGGSKLIDNPKMKREQMISKLNQIQSGNIYSRNINALDPDYSINPIEGVIFEAEKQSGLIQYKLTGSYAPYHQMVFKR